MRQQGEGYVNSFCAGLDIFILVGKDFNMKDKTNSCK